METVVYLMLVFVFQVETMVYLILVFVFQVETMVYVMLVFVFQVERMMYLMLVFVFQVETMVYRADTTSSRLFKILREKISQVTCPPVLTLEEEHGVVVVLC